MYASITLVTEGDDISQQIPEGTKLKTKDFAKKKHVFTKSLINFRMCVRIDDASTEIPDSINVTSAEFGFESGEKLALGDRIPKIWEITTTELPMPEDVAEREEAYGFKGITDPVAIRAKASENLVFAVSSLPEKDKQKLSYNKHEFITKCSFNGRACAIETDFDVYIDPSFGNCFTFNYNASENMTSERAGPSYGRIWSN